MQTMERYTNEKNKNAKIQTEEFRGEFATSLYGETGEERTKVIRTPTLIYPVTVQQRPLGDMYPQGCT